MDNVALPLHFTSAAINKIKNLIANEENINLRLRIYITSGGCGGFQYGFIFDNQVNDDIIIEKEGITVIIDPMSLQYLIGGMIDYTEELEGSRFLIINPNAKSTCSCGFSFSI